MVMDGDRWHGQEFIWNYNILLRLIEKGNFGDEVLPETVELDQFGNLRVSLRFL